MECTSCLTPKQEDILYETKYWRVVIATDQAHLGRSYVPLKRHCGDLGLLKPDEWLDFADLVRRLESALRESFGATMFNWSCWMNYAYQVDPPNPHVHWHLMPRYDHEVEFEGNTFKDPEFGNPCGARINEVSDKLRRKIAETIIGHL